MRQCGVVTETALQESIRKLRQRFTHIITFDTWQRQERQSLMAKGMWPLGACFPTCPWVSNTESWHALCKVLWVPPCTGGPCLQCACLGLRGGYLCRIACVCVCVNGAWTRGLGRSRVPQVVRRARPEAGKGEEIKKRHGGRKAGIRRSTVHGWRSSRTVFISHTVYIQS